MTTPVQPGSNNSCQEEEIVHKTFTSFIGRTYHYDIPTSLESKETDTWKEAAWKGIKRSELAQEQTGLKNAHSNQEAEKKESAELFFKETGLNLCNLV